jgi:hypothetical protein
MQPRGTFVAALLSVIVCVGPALAQQTPRAAQVQAAGTGRPTPARSPEIMQDGKVAFRLLAPDATFVAVRNSTGGFADWPGGNEVAMSKGDDGVWSATVGPLKPEFYTYSFVVNGVRIMDPRNPLQIRNGTNYFNLLRISGGLTDDYAVNDVPHGTVAQVWYPSPMLKLTRRLYVYTPPGYETGKTVTPCSISCTAAAATRATGRSWDARPRSWTT